MRIREFARHSVTVTEPVIVNAYTKEKEYLSSLDMDKLLAGFREAAGLPRRAEPYPGGWENEDYSGHTLGHYMVALAQVYAKEKSAETEERLAYILSELSQCQRQSGYLFTSEPEVFEAVEHGKTYKCWYTMHKIVTGLLAVYKLAGMEQALVIVKKLGGWIVDRVLNWTDKEQRRVLSIADGGMNDCLYELYKITGEDCYAEAAEKFDEADLFTPIAAGKDILSNKAAAETIPKILGALNRYMAFGEAQIRSMETAKNFFDMVIAGHTYVTGGNGELMHFRAAGALAAERTQYNSETCSTHGMMKLAAGLYSVTGDKRYMDYYERAYFNAMLGAQNPEDGMTAFFQPMATGYFKTFSEPFSKFWCCTGTGMEMFTDLSSGIYHASGGGIYVNLYVSSVLEDRALGVKLTQTVDPESYESAEFVLLTEDLKETSLYFRVPEWCGEDIEVSVNGMAAKASVKNGYLSTETKRKSGDRIVLKFHPKVTLNKLPDMENCVALTYGPFVLAAGLGAEAMSTERMKHNNVTVATKNVSVHERILLQKGVTLSEWFDNCTGNLVKKDGELSFTLRGTDADEVLVFRPYYKIYHERYGIYFEYYEEESLTEDLRALIEAQKRLEEEHKAAEKEAIHLAEEEATRLAEEERSRLEEEEAMRLAEEERLHLEEEAMRLAEEERLHLEKEAMRLAEEERLRLEEEEAERLRREQEAEERRLAEAEAERRIREEEERAAEQNRIEAEARQAAAGEVAAAERAAELAEAKRREEEANLQAAKLAAERAEAEAAAQRAEAEAARFRREAEEEERRRLAEEAEAERIRLEQEAEERRRQEAEERRLAEEEAERQRRIEEEEEQRRIDAEARQIAAQKVADAERAAELAEAEARQEAARKVADAERAAELAEANAREEEAKLKAAQLEAERAEAEAVAKKAQTEQAEAEAAAAKAQEETEAAKAAKAENQARQAKANIAASKASKKAAKKRKRRYREFSVGKLLAWIGGVLAVIILLYLFATPISKGFFIGKDAVDTFFAEKLPKVAQVLKVKGNGDAMPVFKDKGSTVYLTEDAEGFVNTTVWPQGYRASVVRLNGKQYICLEGNGLKAYYLNEIAETDSKHVYLENGTEKALYFWDYSFEQPERLCAIAGEFNTLGVKQYVMYTGGVKNAFHVLDAATLEEHKVLLQAETAAQILKVDAYEEETDNVRVNLTAGEMPYSFLVPKKAGAVLPDGYKISLKGVQYTVNEAGIRFDAYVVSEDAYLGKLIGTLKYTEQVYEVDRFDFYAYAGDDYGSEGEAAVMEAVTLTEAQGEHMEVIGDRGESLLVPLNTDVKRYEYDPKSFLTEKNGEISYIRDGKTVSVKGVDVSRNQGTVNWETVAASGVEYAMVRLGIRRDETNGKCQVDANYSRNIKGALKAGLEVGVYFTSRATTVEEAKEEAQFVLKNMKDYDITWPVAVDTVEGIGGEETRASKLSAKERTACVKAFMDEIAAAGYTPVLYTDARWSALKLDLSELSAYDMWYSSKGELAEYPYHYTMWQYTDGREVPGINETADLSISFVDYGEAKRQEQ